MEFNINLDDFQREAVLSDEENLLVIASPGAGKTTVIINRIIHLIKNKGVKYNEIVLLTFTKSAAENMKKRYKVLSKEKNTPYFGTFHSLFYRILKEDIEFNLIDENEAISVIKKTLKNYLDDVRIETINEVLNSISKIKASKVSINELEINFNKEIFKECLSNYEGYKNNKKVMDFDDLQFQAVKFLNNNPKILDKYKESFKYILVDEFQDCDFIQIQFLKNFNSVYAVGDEDQSIYSFRGAIPKIMVNFDKIFFNGVKKYLSTNYRSCESIINVSKMVIENNNDRNKKSIYGFKKKEGLVNIKRFLNVARQGEFISNEILSKNFSGEKFYENAIIFRTNEEVDVIIETFIRYNIPFKFLDNNYNFFDNFICKDILSFFKLSLNPFDRDSFYNIVSKQNSFVSNTSREKVKNFKYKKEVFSILLECKDLSLIQRMKTYNLMKKINKLKLISLQKAIDNIINKLGYMEYLKKYCINKNHCIEDILFILDKFKIMSSKYKDIVSFLKYIEEFGKVLNQINNNGVILSTIHGVKGMEFKRVFIINCNEENLPHKEGINENIEEERRIFYVGITRAIEELTLCSTENFNGKNIKVSRFIEEISLK